MTCQLLRRILLSCAGSLFFVANAAHATAVSIPEPESMALVGIALAAAVVVWVRNRRR
jgi:PEP-CTERM motif